MKTNPLLVALLLVLAAIALYVAVVSPLSDSLFKARENLAKDEANLAAMRSDVMLQPSLKTRIAELEATNRINRACRITPMLNSYPMRVKSLLDAMAVESGFTNIEYSEGTFRALPVPKTQLPEMRTARRSVRVKALADYAALVSLLLRIERDLPTVCLQSFSVSPVRTPNASADLQEVNLVLEWPCEGEVIK